MAEAITQARSHVHVAAWHLMPDFLMMEAPGARIGELLGTVARRAHVRVLLWAGMPLPFGRTSRHGMRSIADELRQYGPIDVALDSRERPLHCHHEKTVVVDDEIAFVGGIDFTRLGTNRLDERSHPLRDGLGWHDAAARLRGPIVQDVANHFRFRWQEVTHRELTEPTIPGSYGSVQAQIVRTIPEHIYRGMPRGDFSLFEAMRNLLHGARRFIYIENQYLWSPEIVDILRDKLLDPPSRDFRVLIVLPSRANTGSDNTRGQLAVLAEADGGRGAFLAVALYSRRGSARRPIYVHAKVCVVDDQWLMLGSGNVNEHSLFNDTEMNLVVQDHELARQTRLSLWAEHLEMPSTRVEGDPKQVFDGCWLPIANEQAERQNRDWPLTHRIARLRHLSRRSDRLIGPLESLFVDG